MKFLKRFLINTTCSIMLLPLMFALISLPFILAIMPLALLRSGHEYWSLCVMVLYFCGFGLYITMLEGE